MYHNKFVVYVTVGEKVLREYGNDYVLMPFKTEYSVCLKNLNSVLAVAKISIDGDDVLDGNEIVVYPNQTIELQGFIKDKTSKNRFRFIEKTSQIENYRDNRPDDGIIKVDVRFQKEKSNQYIPYYHYYYRSDIIPYPYAATWTDQSYGSISYRAVNVTYTGGGMSAGVSVNNVQNDDGITVKGSEINQEFSSAYVNDLENIVHTLILKIKGYKDNKKVTNVFTVKDKIVCNVCGNNNAINAKYCSNCGNFLD